MILTDYKRKGMTYIQESSPPNDTAKGDTYYDLDEFIWINKDGSELKRSLIYKYDDSGDRGIFGGGYPGSFINVIEYITISTTGNATDFGDLTSAKSYMGSTSNGAKNRGIFGGGYPGSYTNVIEYITISTPGNAIDFGDLTIARNGVPATSNGTNERGVFGGGVINASTSVNAIDYITISTIGDAIDFGDLTVIRDHLASTSNGTNDRGIFAGGYNTSSTLFNIIDYITISTIGNATDFGDLNSVKYMLASTSNGTNNRGVFGGGLSGSSINVIEYITISTVGNATDFGDLTVARNGLGATSNGTNERGVFGGGYTTSSTLFNIIDYITISTIGDATDFGDLTQAKRGIGACSNS